MTLVRPAARVLALLSLTLTLLAATGSAGAPARADVEQPVIETTDIGSCSDAPPPCVESILRNGAPLDGYFGFLASETRFHYEGRTMRTVRFGALGEYGSDLGFGALGDVWQVTFDLGDLVPRGAAGSAQDVTVDRVQRPDGSHAVTVTGRPITLSGQCDQYNVCPEWADYPNPDENPQLDGFFNVSVTDFGTWQDPVSLASVHGVDVFTNVAVSSIPPAIRHDDATGADYLWIEMANRHYYEDGVTVVHGRIEVRIPNEFLRVYYGVPNPELMTAESLDPEVSGRAAGSGTVSVTQDPDGDAMLVTITGVTFSHRVAKIRLGVIVPTRPGRVSAERTSPRSALLEFTRADVRGAKVTRYQARCRPTRGSSPVVTATGRSPIAVSGLATGVGYACNVRATSVAGPGPWSRPVTLAR